MRERRNKEKLLTSEQSPVEFDVPAVVCRGLTKRYPGVVAVETLDLRVDHGECFGLLGPNGAGKTTTIEILEGLLEPDAGEVRVLGLSWRSNAKDLRQRVGVQLQETRLSEKLTVAETVRLFRSFYRDGPAVEEVIALVQLAEKANARVGSLSGGQRQRLSLACALTGRPNLLFLDEPTTGLDPQSRRSIWDLVEAFLAGGGTALLTTHYMEEAAHLCDRVGIMDRGRVIALGPPDELVASLGAEHVVEFSVSDGNGQAVTLNAGRVERYRALPDVRSAHAANGRVFLRVGQVHTAVPALLESLSADGLTLAGLSTHGASLEDVFMSLTGRQLRDA
jgi:ABC-2 type transport system ATP-binding protein